MKCFTTRIDNEINTMESESQDQGGEVNTRASARGVFTGIAGLHVHSLWVCFRDIVNHQERGKGQAFFF